MPNHWFAILALTLIFSLPFEFTKEARAIGEAGNCQRLGTRHHQRQAGKRGNGLFAAAADNGVWKRRNDSKRKDQ